MTKILLTLLVLLSTSYATVINEYPSQKMLDMNIPIVDIRTTGEWKQSGLLKGAIPIMFFDEKGEYDAKGFVNELNKKVDTSMPFALICRSGSRTKMIAGFLSQEFGYKVINLQGGMNYVQRQRLPTVPYK